VVCILCDMTTQNKPQTRGRPPVHKFRHKFTLTVAQADFDLLRDIGDLVGSTPSALIREMIEENRATFKDMRASLHDAKAGKSTGALSRMEKRLQEALERGEDLHESMGLKDE